MFVPYFQKSSFHFSTMLIYLVSGQVYLLGTILTGIPRESLIKVWDGILHRLVHIPTQLLSSKNLQNILRKHVDELTWMI